MRSSVAQAFDEDGTDLVLRGPEMYWDVRARRKVGASDSGRIQSTLLLELVLKRYKRETGRMPGRVVVHKTSRFLPAEREGMKDALQSVSQFDLVAVTPTDEIRLVRAGQYPPLRGTLFSVGTTEYLYTTGYVTSLKACPHVSATSSCKLPITTAIRICLLLPKSVVSLSTRN